MKRLFAPLALALTLAAAPAFAAPPTPAQVERLLQVMDAQKMADQIIPAMMQQTRQSLEQYFPADADPADRARADHLVAGQEASLREMLAWKNLQPIYTRVYTDTLSAEEVTAMTRFYESPEGRSVMQKLPLIMQRSMVEMQPLLQSSMQKMMQTLEAEVGKDASAPAPKK